MDCGSEPPVRAAFEVVTIDPLDVNETLDLARRWSQARRGDDGIPPFEDNVLLEAPGRCRDALTDVLKAQ